MREPASQLLLGRMLVFPMNDGMAKEKENEEKQQKSGHDGRRLCFAAIAKRQWRTQTAWDIAKEISTSTNDQVRIVLGKRLVQNMTSLRSRRQLIFGP